MGKAAGRLAELRKNAVLIGGVRVVGFEWAGEYIDVTDRDSTGFIEYLSGGAAAMKSQQITLSVEGVYEDPVLRDIAADPAVSKVLTDLTFKFADALAAKDTISGTFVMENYKEDNPHDDAGSFSCGFKSSGQWTLT